jgi:dTMP kinase
MQSRQPLQFYNEPLPGVDTSDLQGKLIVIEGPDSVGRSTQVKMLRAWLEHQGHAVLDTGLARGALAGKGIAQAKLGNTLGPVTMTLFYATDFADRLENEIIPALRAGFVVLTDRYIFSLIARGVARGEDRGWLEKVAGFALVPHKVFYLRAEVGHLVQRVAVGKGQFDYWESGMDVRFGDDMFDSFVNYQTLIIKAFDRMTKRYDFEVIDATQSPNRVFENLKRSIDSLFEGTESAEPGRNGKQPEAKAAPAPKPPSQKRKKSASEPAKI